MATIRVATVPGRLFATQIVGRDHEITADEPRPDGDDLGFSPYELLLASLGSCTAMTLEMYARRKNWALDKIEISLAFDRVHAGDSAHCEQPESRIDQISVTIELVGSLDQAQRDRLLEIATKCPVNRTLHRGPRILHRLTGTARGDGL